MPRQLEFWTAEQSPPPAERIWTDLEAEERTAVVTILVRMITQAVNPQLIPRTEEKEDER